MKKIKNILKTKEPMTVVSAIVVLVIISITMGYSAFTNTGMIRDMSAVVRVQANIRVTKVSVQDPVSEAVSNYEDYNVNSITSGLSLPNANSKITYKVEVTNFGNAEMILTELTGLPENLKYTIDEENYRLNELICDDNDDTKCTLGAKKTLYITIGYQNSAAYDSSTTTYPFTLNFIFESNDKVAEVNGIYYDTLQEAVTKGVPKNNTETLVRLLKSTRETVTIAQNQNVLFDFQNSVLSNNGNTNVIINNGTVKITNGIISSNAATNGAINNNSTGVITISGGSIIVTGGRQALYNDKGTATITGTAYLSSAATERAAVQNQATGTLTITGGRIVSTGSSAVDNRGNMTIGVEDGDIDETTPIMQGVTYGITATANYNFYNGTAKGKIRGINDDTTIVAKEDGYNIASDEETINGELYQTSFLGVTKTVTFNPNGGTLNAGEGSKNVTVGKKVGKLPTPIRNGYDFEGWFTEESGGEQIGTSRVITEDVTFYAHWIKVNIVQMNGKYYDNIQSAITAAPANTRTTVTLLRDTTENFKVQYNKIIDLNLQNYTVSNNSSKPKEAIIEVYGTIYVNNGTISSSGDSAVINVNIGGKAIISGGNVLATAAKQALYILEGGEAEISGTAYLSSQTTGAYNGMDRGTVQCLSGGTLKITGGIIEGTKSLAISNQGTLTIGVKDGNVDTSTPVLIGKVNGVKTSGTFNFYDGIIKGQTAAINGTVSDQEDNSQITNGTETIDGASYKTNYLELNS